MTWRTRVDPVQLAESLRALLDQIEAGRLDATPALRARIEGAIVACDVLTGGSVDNIVERLSRTC